MAIHQLPIQFGHLPFALTRAAMLYLHGSDERQQAIADALSRKVADELARSRPGSSDTQRPRRQRKAS